MSCETVATKRFFIVSSCFKGGDILEQDDIRLWRLVEGLDRGDADLKSSAVGKIKHCLLLLAARPRPFEQRRKAVGRAGLAERAGDQQIGVNAEYPFDRTIAKLDDPFRVGHQDRLAGAFEHGGERAPLGGD
jgi:hypothetical protein